MKMLITKIKYKNKKISLEESKKQGHVLVQLMNSFGSQEMAFEIAPKSSKYEFSNGKARRLVSEEYAGFVRSTFHRFGDSISTIANLDGKMFIVSEHSVVSERAVLHLEQRSLGHGEKG
jgi:hypothetical protein